MNRISATFDRVRCEGRAALMPFITMGYPNLDSGDPVQRPAGRWRNHSGDIATGARQWHDTGALSGTRAGADGVIVPDLPPEEADELRTALHAYGLALIFLLAPTSDDERVRLVAERAAGFIYLVSLTGVTGARDQLPPDLADFVARVRRATDLPLAVGFGISRPDQAAMVAQIADGVIVGSALLRAIGDANDPIAAARAFVRHLREAVAPPSHS